MAGFFFFLFHTPCNLLIRKFYCIDLSLFLLQVLLSIIIIILIFFHPLQDLYRVHFCNFPEGPWSLPIIGGIHHLGIKWPHLAVQELVKKYGRVFSIRMGPVGRIVFISDYELVNKVGGA